MTKKSMLCGTLRLMAKGLAVLLAILLLGCSGNADSQAHLGLSQFAGTPLGDLPPIPLDLGIPHSVAAEQSYTIGGTDEWFKSVGATEFSGTLRIPSGPNSWLCGIYQLDVGTNSLLSTKVNCTVPNGENCWLGIANYETKRWQFLGPLPSTSNTTFNGLSAGNFVSPGGHAYVVVVSCNLTTSLVQSVEYTTDTVPPVTYTVAGTVTAAEGGAPLAGASMLANPGNYQVSSDSEGNYLLLGMTAGTYTVSAALEGYSFAPPTQEVTIGPDVTGINFTGTVDVSTYTVTGTVTDSDGGGLFKNVVVYLMPENITDITDDNGIFSFAGVASGLHTVTPVYTDYTFSPPDQTVSLGPNATGVDFVGTLQVAQTFTLSGQVSNTGGGWLGNVTMNLAPLGLTTLTNGSGQYSFGSLDAGAYTVTAQLTDYTFEPSEQIRSLGPDASNVDFAGTLNQGPVTYENDIKPMLGTGSVGHCMPCHNTQTHFGNIRLDTYGNAFANADAAYFESSNNFMPPGGPFLSPDEKALFLEWIDTGKAP